MNVIGGYFGSAPYALKAAGDAKSIQFLGKHLLNSACMPRNIENMTVGKSSENENSPPLA